MPELGPTDNIILIVLNKNIVTVSCLLFLVVLGKYGTELSVS